MAKCMAKKNGEVVRVDNQTAEKLYQSGQARYISKDEYRRMNSQKESANGKG